MKGKTKRLLTVFLVFVLVIAMGFSVIACGNVEEPPSTGDDSDLTVVSLTLDTSKAKLTFDYKETFTTDGLVVKATMSDESIKEIPVKDCTVSKPNMTSPGRRTVRVQYGGKSASYQITVRERVMPPISATPLAEIMGEHPEASYRVEAEAIDYAISQVHSVGAEPVVVDEASASDGKCVDNLGVVDNYFGFTFTAEHEYSDVIIVLRLANKSTKTVLSPGAALNMYLNYVGVSEPGTLDIEELATLKPANVRTVTDEHLLYTYTGEAASGTEFTIEVYDDGSVIITVDSGIGDPISVNGNWTLNSDTITITSEDGGVVYTGTMGDGVITYESVTGTASEYVNALENVSFTLTDNKTENVVTYNWESRVIRDVTILQGTNTLTFEVKGDEMPLIDYVDFYVGKIYSGDSSVKITEKADYRLEFEDFNLEKIVNRSDMISAHHLRPGQCFIENSPSSGGKSVGGYIEGTEVSTTLEIGADATVAIKMVAASVNDYAVKDNWEFYIDGELLTGVEHKNIKAGDPSKSEWWMWRDTSLGTYNLSAGNHEFVAKNIHGSGLNTDYFGFDVVSYGSFDPTGIVIHGNLKSITVETEPTKTEYAVGEFFDPAGMVVKANYVDGYSVRVTDYDYVKTAITAGTDHIELTYKGKTASVAITIADKTVTGITVKTAPKTAYAVGETFSLAGLVLDVTYSDSTTTTASFGFTADVEGELTAAETGKTVTVSYAGQTTTYNIDVYEVNSVIGNDNPVSVVEAETLSLDNITPDGHPFGKTEAWSAGGKSGTSVRGMSSGDYLTVTMYVTDNVKAHIIAYAAKAEAEDVADKIRDVVVDGTTTLGTPSVMLGEGNGSQYYNWKPVDYGEIELEAGIHSFVLTFLAAVNFDRFEIMVVPDSIHVETQPDTVKYAYGDEFSLAGLAVTATYGTAVKPLTGYTVDKSGAVTESGTVTVSYLGKEDTFDITCLTLDKIEVTGGKTAYREGESVDTTGMTVTAVYGTGEGKIERPVSINSCTVTPNGALTSSDDHITVAYGGKSADVSISVVTLESLSATGTYKTDYKEGETLDATGLVINAVYGTGAQGQTIPVSLGACSFSFDISKSLAPTDTLLTISYGGKSIDIPLTVDALQSISVAGLTTSYTDGARINTAGAIVTATYASGATGTIATNKCTFTVGGDEVLLQYMNKVTVSYAGKTCDIAITVSSTVHGTIAADATVGTVCKIEAEGLDRTYMNTNGESQTEGWSAAGLGSGTTLKSIKTGTMFYMNVVCETEVTVDFISFMAKYESDYNVKGKYVLEVDGDDSILAAPDMLLGRAPDGSNDWANFKDVNNGSVTLSAGTHTIVIRFIDNGPNIDSFRLKVTAVGA